MGIVAKEPHGIEAVGDDQWVEIDVQVDSGATETVMAVSTLQGVIDIVEGSACKHGVTYEVANGAEIPNLWERKFLGYMEDGAARAITAQVCAVNQTLMSVSKIASKGNRVVFDDDGSYIEDKPTGERTWMTQVGGMYSLKMWVSRKSTAEAVFQARSKALPNPSGKEKNALMPVSPSDEPTQPLLALIGIVPPSATLVAC